MKLYVHEVAPRQHLQHRFGALNGAKSGQKFYSVNGNISTAWCIAHRQGLILQNGNEFEKEVLDFAMQLATYSQEHLGGLFLNLRVSFEPARFAKNHSVYEQCVSCKYKVAEEACVG